MDLPGHVLWTGLGVKILNQEQSAYNLHPLWTILLATSLPDILETGPFLVYTLWHHKKYNITGLKSLLIFTTNTNHHNQTYLAQEFPRLLKWSWATHSIVFALVLPVICYLIHPVWAVPFFIGYIIHIVMDTLLHTDLFAIRPLYPFHSVSIRGICTWYRTKNFTFYNYSLLVVLYLLFIIRF